MNSPITISQLNRLPIIICTKPSMPGSRSSTVSNMMNSPTAPAKCR